MRTMHMSFFFTLHSLLKEMEADKQCTGVGDVAEGALVLK
jgi:hypothetical protein